MKQKTKGIQWLTGVAYGIVGLVMIVGIGIVVLQKIGDSVVTCAAAFPTWNATTQLCQNASGSTTAGAGTAYTGISYGVTQLGSTGLLSWLPAVIALIIGVFFLAYFAGKKKEY
jgi:hypothetical protein